MNIKILRPLERKCRNISIKTVHGHRCQQRELLLGQVKHRKVDIFYFSYSFTQTVMPDETVAFPKVRLVAKPGQALRPSTMVRISLVDIRSSSEDIVDHWHRLVDCREEELLPPLTSQER